jgi:hypothetical protein
LPNQTPDPSALQKPNSRAPDLESPTARIAAKLIEENVKKGWKEVLR